MKKDPRKKEPSISEKIRASDVFAAVACAVLCIMLAFIALDGERYKKEDSVPVSISFTPPEKPEPTGFWDIFSEAVVHLLNIGN